jgi:hypothetical protein
VASNSMIFSAIGTNSTINKPKGFYLEVNKSRNKKIPKFEGPVKTASVS